MNSIKKGALLLLVVAISIAEINPAHAILRAGTACTALVLAVESRDEANGDATVILTFTAAKIYGQTGGIRTIYYTGPRQTINIALQQLYQRQVTQIYFDPSNNRFNHFVNCRAGTCAYAQDCNSF